MARLTIKKDDELIAEFPIESRATRIGRDEGNDIVLPGEEVSRFHSRIIKTDSGCLIEDLGSAKGTYVNDNEISHAYLSDGDVIFLGEYTLYFHLSKTEQEAIAVPPETFKEETTAPPEPAKVLPSEEESVPAPEVEPTEPLITEEKQASIPKETELPEAPHPEEEPALVPAEIRPKITRPSTTKGIPWGKIILIILFLSGGLWATYLLLPKPTPPEVLLARGVNLAKEGEYEMAISKWEMIPKDQPEHKTALEYIKRATERLATVELQEKTGAESSELKETQAADTGGRVLERMGEEEVRPSLETIKSEKTTTAADSLLSPPKQAPPPEPKVEKAEVKPEASPAQKAVDRKNQSEEALAAYNDGIKALEIGDLEGAASLFRKAVALNPSLKKAQGKLTAVESRLSEARQHIDQALEAENEKNWTKALTEWKRVADLIRDPIHPIYKTAADGQVRAKRGLAVNHLSRGRALAKQGEVTQAIKEFEQVITLQPETKLADNARQELTQVQERLSELLEPRYNEAVKYYEQRQLPEALSKFQEITRIQSDYRDVSATVSKIKLALIERAKGLYVEGLQLRAQRQDEEAKKKWQEIIRLLSPMPDSEYYQKAKKRLQE
ncbi:MAG: FHA domain-containing protein [bacterium]